MTGSRERAERCCEVEGRIVTRQYADLEKETSKIRWHLNPLKNELEREEIPRLKKKEFLELSKFVCNNKAKQSSYRIKRKQKEFFHVIKDVKE